MRPAAALVLLVASGLVSPACTVVRSPSGHGPAAAPQEGVHSWPPAEPRIELVRVLGVHGDLGGSSLAGWFRGDRKERLFQRPYGVAWDGDALVVADPGAGRVLRVEGRGRIRRSPDGLLGAPTFVAACPGGLVVSDPPGGRVALLDHDLRLVRWLATDLARPTGVACVGDRIFALETGAHRLVELVPDGARPVLGTRGDGPGEFNFPTALASDGGTLWVGDTLNFRIQRVDPTSGAVLGEFGALGDAPGQMPRIKDIAVDAGGRLWITDALLDQVALYTREGGYLMSIGRSGTAPGEFTFPAGVDAAPDGRVVVVDSFNRRLQVFAPIDGEVTP